MVTTPARHGVAVIGVPLDAPDLDGLGRADPFDQLLEVNRFPVVVETPRGLLAPSTCTTLVSDGESRAAFASDSSCLTD